MVRFFWGFKCFEMFSGREWKGKWPGDLGDEPWFCCFIHSFIHSFSEALALCQAL